MNNLRLLAGLLCATLAGFGARSYGQRVVTLEEIFDIAETNSARIRASRAEQQVADRDISVARAGRLPDINARLSLAFNGNGFTTARDFSDCQKAPIPHFGNSLGVTVIQPVYSGGAITNSIRLAELKSSAARFATELQRDNVRFSLAGDYLDLYKCANLQRVVEGNLSSAREVLREMRARHEQGTVLTNDITRYELLVSNLELELTRISNTRQILNAAIVSNAGMQEGTLVLPDSTILTRSMQANDAAWWQQQGADHSPQISLARSGVEISRKAEDLTRADRLPKVALQAAWQFNGPILTEVPPINRNLSYWFVGVGVDYNLSSLYKTNKSLARSKAATFKARSDLETARRDLSLAVRSDYIRYLEAFEELKTRDKGVELAMRNYNTVSTRYAAGMALITDLLDAANSRLDAEQQLVNARINIIYQYYKLLFTTGTI